MISFFCRGCNHKYTISDKYAGKKVRCKKCDQVNRIPSPKDSVSFVNEDTLPATQVSEQEQTSFPKALIVLIAVVFIFVVLLASFAVVHVKKKRTEYKRQQFVKRVSERRQQLHGYDSTKLKELIDEESDEYEIRILARVMDYVRTEEAKKTEAEKKRIAEAKIRAEAEAKIRAEAEAKIRVEAKAKLKAEAEEQRAEEASRHATLEAVPRIGGVLDHPQTVIEALNLRGFHALVLEYAILDYNDDKSEELYISSSRYFDTVIKKASITGSGVTKEVKDAERQTLFWLNTKIEIKRQIVKILNRAEAIRNNGQAQEWNRAVLELIKMDAIPKKYRERLVAI